mmetsp:Transcript_9629/g.28999  ORF Transcript_9629/g.28999 Transcript_9629/m.28999 type:complete len:399 (+) Transcript_9629:234-1430(+)|eukprot:CAMPEP_0206147796 /NCGR_PEP_ID=MMETSP1473-20131121/34583_1 /ASSEMBLY_ACC=CAM_ASM_001109 /TAXON_ID=1461547 /ORGANISM="Stichococcus sp, Strain RCC1054" /LENGTH=398 /DNA_ID=CAMNT_0053544885 /DNA_START=152 /DNA_END=1348 /DNA_ORIENTATION=+
MRLVAASIAVALTMATVTCMDAMTCDAAVDIAPERPPCPCPDPKLCRPITIQHDREVFGFSTRREGQYAGYDWDQLTTVAWNTDPSLMCIAHSHGARVVLNADVSTADWLTDADARAAWIQKLLDRAHKYFMDGVNFDLEVPLAAGSPEAAGYTALVAEAATAFHGKVPSSQVSVDIPWSPHGIDNRHFDWPGLAAAADLLFIMSYDMQSQIWGRCVASANTPLALMARGIDQWLALPLPPQKLVLGIPWYGYKYDCIGGEPSSQLCELAPYDFRGSPCSDAVGRQKEYQEIMQVPEAAHTQWDGVQQSPYFSINNTRWSQMWYDNPASLTLKAKVAAQKGLRGIGMWHLDCLDYKSEDADVRTQTLDMWASLRPFTRGAQSVLPSLDGEREQARLHQ